MEHANNNAMHQSTPVDWHGMATKGMLLGKLLLVLFLLGLLVTYTIKYLRPPYSVFVVGLEVSVAMIALFTIIRMNTFVPVKPYDFKNLQEQKEPVKLLLTNLDFDIARYEAGSRYYFNGVRFYKYSTIILAGLSTIILGLDFSDYGDMVVLGRMRYTTLAKNIALIIGAIITITTALMTYWNIEKYWLTNKTIVNKLRALRDDIEADFVAGKLAGAEPHLDEKIAEYKNIKGDFYKYWEGALADRGSVSGQGQTNGGS
jgi:uncharacterized membrane protein